MTIYHISKKMRIFLSLVLLSSYCLVIYELIANYRAHSYYKALKRLLEQSPDTLSAIDRINTIKPIDAEHFYLLGKYYLRLAESQQSPEYYQKALDCAQKALEQKPYAAHYHLLAGWCYANLSRLNGEMQEIQPFTENQFKWALVLAPHDAYIPYSIAYYYAELDQEEKAIPLFQRAIQNNIRYLRPILDYYYDLTGDFTILTELIPDTAGAHLGLARYLHRKRQPELAETEYHMAIKLNPEDAYAHFYLGHIYKQKKEYDQAVSQYSHAVQLQPHNPLFKSVLDRTSSSIRD